MRIDGPLEGETLVLFCDKLKCDPTAITARVGEIQRHIASLNAETGPRYCCGSCARTVKRAGPAACREQATLTGSGHNPSSEGKTSPPRVIVRERSLERVSQVPAVDTFEVSCGGTARHSSSRRSRVSGTCGAGSRTQIFSWCSVSAPATAAVRRGARRLSEHTHMWCA